VKHKGRGICRVVLAAIGLVGWLYEPRDAVAQLGDAAVDSALTRLLGSWRVEYRDANLGPVGGYAVVHRSEFNGRLRVRYFVEDPRSRRTQELTLVGAAVTGRVLELEAEGPGPSSAVTADGGPGSTSAVILDALPAGGSLSASIGSKTAALPVVAGDAGRPRVTLRLPLPVGAPANRLDAEWRVYRRDRSGFRGLRSGSRFQDTLPLGTLRLPHEAMRGAETWTRGGPQVERVTIANMQTFARLAEQRTEYLRQNRLTSAWLRVEGRFLPVGPTMPVAVSFDESTLRYTGDRRPDPSVPGALQIEVSVHPRITPGRKLFTLNGSSASVLFDFPGLEARLRHVRPGREDQHDPAHTLYPGEVYQVEVEFLHEPFYDSRWVVSTASSSEPPVFLRVRKDPERPTVFRSESILLLEPRDPGPPDGAIVKAHMGDRLESSMADVSDGAVASSEVAAAADGIGRFQRALALARSLRQRFPEPNRYRVTNVVITELGTRSIEISREDHAALIVLHEELRNQLATALKAGGPTPWDAMPQFRNARQALVQTLITASRAALPEDPPHLLYTVPGPEGRGELRLKQALGVDVERAMPGGTEAERQARFFEYAERAVTAAERRMSEQMSEALARLDAIDFSAPTGELLAAGRTAYPALGRALAISLMRDADPTKGEGAYPRLVPDRVGRDAVMQIDRLFDAIRGQEAYASFDKFYVSIVTAPLFFLSGGLQVAGRAAGLAARIPVGAGIRLTEGIHAARGSLIAMKLGQAGEDFHRAYDASQAASLAAGTAEVTGTNAYWSHSNDAKAAMWSGAFNVIDAAGGPLFARAAEYGLRPSEGAMRTAVFEATTRGVERIGSETKRVFRFAREMTEYKLAHRGVEALTDFDREVLRAAYPAGIPSDVARRLGLPTTHPGLPVLKGDIETGPVPAGGGTGASARPSVDHNAETLPRLSQQDEAAALRNNSWGLDQSGKPGTSSSQLARADEAARAAARRGDHAGAFRLRLEQQRLTAGREPTAAEEASARAAWDAYQRLKKDMGVLANVDEIDVLDELVLSARPLDGSIPPPPEEALAKALYGRGIYVMPEDLGRAAGVSPAAAEAALVEAHRMHGRPWRVDGSTADLGAPAIPPGTPPAETVAMPGSSAPPPAGWSPAMVKIIGADAPYVAAIEKELARYGINDLTAAVFYGARHMDPRTVAAGVLLRSRRMSVADVMAKMQANRDELRRLFDDYLRANEWEPNAVRRAELVEKVLNQEPPTRLEPPQTPASKPGESQARPPGLDTRPPPSGALRNAVLDRLVKMGLSRNQAEALPIEAALQDIGDPVLVAAGLAHANGVAPAKAADALDATVTQYAGYLDRYQEALLPLQPPTSRAADVARQLRNAGVSEPMGRLLASRQSRAKAALDDLGVPGGDAGLIARGLDVESAIVGRAMEHDLTAIEIMTRRNLGLAELREHADSYLRYGRGITDRLKRKELVDKFFRDAYPAEQAQWRLTPPEKRVLVSEDELAQALEKVDVEPNLARQRAKALREVGARDAHEAIAGAALNTSISPDALRRQFGLSAGQIARKIDAYLLNHIGMRDRAHRAARISAYFRQFPGHEAGADDVRRMLQAPTAADPPLRPFSTRNFSAPTAPPDSPLSPAASTLEPPRDLTERFGAPIKPRAIMSHERGPNGAVLRNPELIEPGSGRLELQPGLPYIWAVDERGRLLIGVASPRRGQPLESVDLLGPATLVGGGPARITGELYFDGQWVINNRAGRYASGPAGPRTSQQLQNVGRLFEQAGVPVRIDFLPFP
jgi:hypothetical protein